MLFRSPGGIPERVGKPRGPGVPLLQAQGGYVPAPRGYLQAEARVFKGPQFALHGTARRGAYTRGAGQKRLYPQMTQISQNRIEFRLMRRSLIVSLFACVLAGEVAAQTLVIRHANLIDGVSAQPLRDATVFIRDGRIESILTGPAAIPGGYTEIGRAHV